MVKTRDSSTKFTDYLAQELKKKIVVSLVVPSYNEEVRIPVMLSTTIDVIFTVYLQKSYYSM